MKTYLLIRTRLKNIFKNILKHASGVLLSHIKRNPIPYKYVFDY